MKQRIKPFLLPLVLLLALLTLLAPTEHTQATSTPSSTTSMMEEPPPTEVLDEFVLYSDNAEHIRVVPLVQGALPDLNVGMDLTASAYCEDDLAFPARSRILHNRDFITTWADAANEIACYSRFTENGSGGFNETQLGDWPYGWSVRAVANLNQDGYDDLLLLHKVQSGFSDYQYKVAIGQPDGSFDLAAAPITLVTDKWGASATLADGNADGKADLIYYWMNSGGSYTMNLYMLLGNGDGTFAAVADKELLFSSPHAANTPLFADFEENGHADIFLSPDDDVPNAGQSHIALNNGTNYTLQESIDFHDHDGWGTDWFSAGANTVDLNLDGHLDIIGYPSHWGDNPYEVIVHWGDGSGEFTTSGETLISGFNSDDPYKPTLAWIPHIIPNQSDDPTSITMRTFNATLPSASLLAMALGVSALTMLAVYARLSRHA